MKDISITVLALLAVVFSLVSLLSAERAPESAGIVRIELPQRMPDVGPRFVLAAR
jgi:hypothetical protein